MSRRIFIVAAEASGDALGADLVKALRGRDPGLEFAGVGGEALAAAGVPSAIDIKGLAILGLIDGLKAYPRVVALADQAAAAAAAFHPHAAVLIDSWGFTLRVAQRLRTQTPRTRLVKYVGPQVWASRPGRAKTLAAAVDHLICIHDFETPYYAPFGLPCTVCGHPAMGRHAPGDGARLRARLGLAPAQRFLLLLPGSRSGELRRVGPVILEAARRLKAARLDMAVALVAAGPVRAAAEAVAAAAPDVGAIVLEEADKADAMAAATAAIAASGTVTTEAALQGAPVVVGYRLGWITWALARAFLYKAPFATLMNVAAGREVAPERLQTRCTPGALAALAAPLLDDPAARAAQVAAQNAALDAMGRGARPAAEIAADAVLAEAAQAGF